MSKSLYINIIIFFIIFINEKLKYTVMHEMFDEPYIYFEMGDRNIYF